MLVTFSSRILARFQTGPPEILAAGKILTARNFVSRRKSRQHSTEISGYPPRSPARLPPGSCRDFGRRDSRLPPRIPARLPPESCRDFGRRESRLPPRILARFPPGIPPPAKNPGKNPGGNRESWRPKSRRDLSGNLGGILPRSRQDPGTIFTRAGNILKN